MKYLVSLGYLILGFLMGHYGLGGLLSLNMEYSFTSSFISLIVTFILVLNTKNNWNNLLYLSMFSLGSFTGIDFEIPDILRRFLSISEEHSWLISFFAGLFKLYVAYLILILKVVFVDKENNLSRFFKLIPFEIKILVFSFSITMLQVWCEYVFPGQIGYILNEHTDNLKLLHIIGLSGYTYFLTYFLTLIAFSIKEKKYNNYLSYSMIIIFMIINYNYVKTDNMNYQLSNSLNTRIIQYPFHELKSATDFPDNFIKEELYPIIEYGENIDLILLPEASMPYVYKTYEDFSQILLIKDVRNFKRNIQLSLFKEEKGKQYNTSILYKYNRKPQFYYKEQLFPIGEYDPFLYSSMIPRDNFWTEMNIKDNKKRLFKIKDVSYLPLLCFENYNPNLFIKTDSPWSFVTVQSNESWIFNKKFRKYLLNFIKIRAKEFNSFILKSDTSGPSAIIDNNGNLIVSILKDKEFYDYSIPKKISNNGEFYYKYRELVILIIGLCQIFIICLFLGFKNLFNLIKA